MSTSALPISLAFGSLAVSFLVVALVRFWRRYQDLRATFNKFPGPLETFPFGNALLFDRDAHGRSIITPSLNSRFAVRATFYSH